MAAPAEPRTPNMHRAKPSLLESADGSMATVATRREKKPLSIKNNKESTWLRPAFSWKAFTLTTRSMGEMAMLRYVRRRNGLGDGRYPGGYGMPCPYTPGLCQWTRRGSGEV